MHSSVGLEDISGGGGKWERKERGGVDRGGRRWSRVPGDREGGREVVG